MNEPIIEVGIISAYEISFELVGEYLLQGTDEYLCGNCTAKIRDSFISVICDNRNLFVDHICHLVPVDDSCKIVLRDVTIGVGFHWQRNEDQVFNGSLKIKLDGKGQIVVINSLLVESYLKSVISSEMRATSSLELLKAHAVISRSWLLAQIGKNKSIQQKGDHYQSEFRTNDEIIKWYDREDHVDFDVCADDHCQRYQGITRLNTALVIDAVDSTRGEVLMYINQICDARFSKCCGGVTEEFGNVWEPVNHPYLQSFADNKKAPKGYHLDLKEEAYATNWIEQSPPAFCNTSDATILKQVLNDYDLETPNFYRWTISYSAKKLSEIVLKKSGIDFGLITDLIPLERGHSGRIIRLFIVGEKRSMIVGKELEIRKWLSPTHLYSSAFVVEKQEKNKKVVFALHGAGWGHGVGLCQIGAAVMGAKGYQYNQILEHYFRGAQLKRRYE